MPVHNPPRCINSCMATLSSSVVLLNSGSYPSYNSYNNQTWTWNGTDWTAITTSVFDPAGPLPARNNAIMSYDGTNLMLFGGQSGSSMTGLLNDTWTWNGTAWSKKSPATSPFARFNAGAAYLAGTGVVMFGGCNLLYNLEETWVWNGTTWSLLAPTNTPGARTDHMMAASASAVIMFGGKSTNSSLNDTWSFSAGNWTKLTPATSPSVRSDATMSYDSHNSLYVMFGGKNDSTYLNETWTFNGTTWTQQFPTVAPEARISAQMSFDPTTNTTLLVGGINAKTNYPSLDTWSFNSTTMNWTKL